MPSRTGSSPGLMNLGFSSSLMAVLSGYRSRGSGALTHPDQFSVPNSRCGAIVVGGGVGAAAGRCTAAGLRAGGRNVAGARLVRVAPGVAVALGAACAVSVAVAEAR